MARAKSLAVDNEVLMDDVTRTVLEMVLAAGRRKAPQLAEVRREQRLVDDLGLGSLDYAALVAALEMALDVDPFAAEASITDIRTVGDLCDVYVKSAAGRG
jgi:acyl carrier protein